MVLQNNSDIVVSTLRQIIRAIDLQSKKLSKRYGLTGPQLIVLKEIHKGSDRPISAIAKEVSLSQATVTSILDRLEQQGFATRQRSSLDKRKVNILLTEKSEKILDTNPSLLQEEFTDEFEKLEEWEKNMIISSLQRMASMLNAEKIISPPLLVSGPIAATSQEVYRFMDEDSSSNSEVS
ncbi:MULTISPECIES: MarR family winged helix-turn-helix transcriptional regulator [unclassified Oceanispirochaeta]|uniref:MarR family winged helix-turn-helix transcriptional regulator n=1 Tax=unclassified Oceanispirochaeta TaxID=2635722 RepID=UPI000E092525|nr:MULTISPECIES: MarR family winged helix-turn-helix transcriptional regulator [unclassified Oceanispirochaeta]MBF9014655.1 winged helix-turn-helix transcriptional regulator [Oceanispirochaeta sp. M2]NPD70911.1 winged helix-turn-helix transcriptional regulator [Oceanispirochaeta sp. M1]RDG33747.1 MarR family transcriptional regulator [Oceanispirochaeta sp. M1]